MAVPGATPSRWPRRPRSRPTPARTGGAFGVTRVTAVDGELELATERHPTDDGSWQPPPEQPMRARLCSPVLAIATAPEPLRGALVDFDPEATPPAWVRLGGRTSVRV